MWTCSKCYERLEDNFDVCWKCGTSQSGVEDPGYEPEPSGSHLGGGRPVLACVRCQRELDYIGNKTFHEGARLGVFGDLGELFVHTQSFDVYVCSGCGHVEFFLHGVGDNAT